MVGCKPMVSTQLCPIRKATQKRTPTPPPLPPTTNKQVIKNRIKKPRSPYTRWHIPLLLIYCVAKGGWLIGREENRTPDGTSHCSSYTAAPSLKFTLDIVMFVTGLACVPLIERSVSSTGTTNSVGGVVVAVEFGIM
jgi:hypothetical protein